MFCSVLYRYEPPVTTEHFLGLKFLNTFTTMYTRMFKNKVRRLNIIYLHLKVAGMLLIKRRRTSVNIYNSVEHSFTRRKVIYNNIYLDDALPRPTLLVSDSIS